MKPVIQVNRLFAAIETLWDNAAPQTSIAARDGTEFAEYSRYRRGNSKSRRQDYLARLPSGVRDLDPGETDAVVLDFLLNATPGRVLSLQGSPGAGKSSLLHFCAHALERGLGPAGPQLHIVNGLALDSRLATREEILGLVAQTVAPDARLSLTGTDEMLGLAVDRIREAERQRRAVLAFDNVDQLHPSVLFLLLEIVRILNVTTGVTTVICLRPGPNMSALRSGVAGAFVTYTEWLTAPSLNSWLESVTQRARRLTPGWLRGSKHAQVDHTELTEHVLGGAFSRIAHLLSNKDWALNLLEEGSAGNIRRLGRMVRRIVSSTTFPYQWVLTGDQRHSSRFDAVTACINGSNREYVADADIPNLFGFRSVATGTPHPLLIHRILTLLATTDLQADVLLARLRVLGYRDEVAVEALGLLAKAGYVESLDYELTGAVLEGRLRLTSGGHYAITRLMSHFDYILAATTAGDGVRRKKTERATLLDRFIRHCASLEAAELAHLERRVDHLHSSLPHILDALRRFPGVTQCLTRAYRTLSEQLPRRTGAEPTRYQHIADHRALVTSIDNLLMRLDGAVRERPGAEEGCTLLVGGLRLVLRAPRESSVGLALHVLSATGDPLPEDGSIVALAVGEDTVVAATATTHEARPGELRARLSHTASESLAHAVAVDPESVRASVRRVLVLPGQEGGRGGGNRAYFVASMGSPTTFRMQLVLADTRAPEPFVLTDRVEAEELLRVSREVLSRLTARALAGSLTTQDVEMAGAKFSACALGKDGGQILSGMRNQIDELVVLSRHSEIPWELLSFPASPGRRTELLSTHWWVRRLAVSGSLDVVAGLVAGLRLAAPIHAPSTGRVATLGRRGPSPVDAACAVSEWLMSRSADRNVLHVIGHRPGTTAGLIKIHEDGTEVGEIDASTIAAYPPASGRVVVLSSCDASVIVGSESIPIALAEQAGSHVFAPLVGVLRAQAEALDDQLHAGSNDAVDICLRRWRQQAPLLFLYAHYLPLA